VTLIIFDIKCDKLKHFIKRKQVNRQYIILINVFMISVYKSLEHSESIGVKTDCESSVYTRTP
jgi:hypothetical protein